LRKDIHNRFTHSSPQLALSLRIPLSHMSAWLNCQAVITVLVYWLVGMVISNGIEMKMLNVCASRYLIYALWRESNLHSHVYCLLSVHTFSGIKQTHNALNLNKARQSVEPNQWICDLRQCGS